MEDLKDKMNINSSKSDLLFQIEKELDQIIEYIQINLMNIKNKEIDFDEKKNKK